MASSYSVSKRLNACAVCTRSPAHWPAMDWGQRPACTWLASHGCGCSCNYASHPARAYMAGRGLLQPCHAPRSRCQGPSGQISAHRPLTLLSTHVLQQDWGSGKRWHWTDQLLRRWPGYGSVGEAGGGGRGQWWQSRGLGQLTRAFSTACWRLVMLPRLASVWCPWQTQIGLLWVKTGVEGMWLCPAACARPL